MGVGFARELFSGVFIIATHTILAATATTSGTTAKVLTRDPRVVPGVLWTDIQLIK